MKVFRPILALLFLSLVVSSATVFSMDDSGVPNVTTTTSTTTKAKKKRYRRKEKDASGTSASASVVSSIATTTTTSSAVDADDGSYVDDECYQEGDEFCSGLCIPSSKSEVRVDDYEGVSVQEMEEVLATAPEEAQDIVLHLENPAYNNRSDYRIAIFAGPPGTGKSTTAQSIGFKLKKFGWKVEQFKPVDVRGNERGETSKRLISDLAGLIEKDCPVLVIIDELNDLLDNADDKKYDTAETARAFWQFLDSQMGNDNFFLIGTMNEGGKIPQAMKTRIEFDCIMFEEIKSSLLRQRIFLSKLIRPGVFLSKNVTATFLKERLSWFRKCTGRHLNGLTRKATLLARRDNKAAPYIIVRKKHIDLAMKGLPNTRSFLEYETIRESDEKRQERHHQKLVALHEESMDRQDLQFKYQQRAAASVQHKNATWSLGGPGLAYNRSTQQMDAASKQQVGNDLALYERDTKRLRKKVQSQASSSATEQESSLMVPSDADSLSSDDDQSDEQIDQNAQKKESWCLVL